MAGPADAVPVQQLGEHPPAVGLDQLVAEGLDRVLQASGPQLAERPDREQPFLLDRLLPQLGPLEERSGVPKSGEVLLARQRVVRMHRMLHVVE
ncbi:hypothetical protein [Kribbella catacumbae]|uniref:hypothetical protein n=1 Tax=Kribbella catacumbae TaxID=460086 RepID=UPI00035E38A1|nr:hypothetical protein [Kribbella catacumbae]